MLKNKQIKIYPIYTKCLCHLLLKLLHFFILQQIKNCLKFILLLFFRLIVEGSRINTNLFVLQCVSFCRVLDRSCSLCPSINSVSADFTSNWCSSSSSLVDWWKYSSIYCWTAVGRASLKMWLLWEELHWRCDCCGRSFTEAVIGVGGASVTWLFSRFFKIKNKSVT